MPYSEITYGRALAAVQQEWQGAATPIPPACVHELFSTVARQALARTAIEAGDVTLTYAMLEARANRLARWLRRRGVGPEVRVGVCAERGIELVLGLLAILKAGGAYVPLDPAYPADRLRGMMEDARLPLVLVQTRLADTLPAGAGVTVPFTSAETEAAEEDAEPFESGATPDNLAYVLFTSGSTGRPKGVMVTHRSVVRLVKQDAYLEFRSDDVFLQFVPAAFDVSTFEIWGPLLAGARLVMFPPRTPSLDELGRFVEERGITTLWLTSGIFHQMVDARVKTFRGVRTLLSGGDVLSALHCKRVLQGTSGLTLVNGYGPTEVTCFTTCHRMHAPDAVGESVSIGRPIANTTAYVLDGEMRPLGVDAVGELFAGGAGVARGYQGSPALTAERFVPDPFSGAPGARLYRTGDAARWRPDGTLEFLGRLDQQVKIRGHRIEPGEVEAALLRHPAVREATVIAREDVPGDRRLVAYVVAEEEPDRDALRAHLQALLPPYMVPSAFVTLRALPLTPNGKVDRRALLAPRMGATAETYAAPRTPTEELLANAWAEVLGVARVGVNDDVFSLGAHSLASMRVGARVRDALGIEVSIAQLFGHPTVAGLARAVDEGTGRGPEFSPIVPVPRDGPLPLSAAQEGVWIIQQLEPGSRAYHFEATIRIRGTLQVPLLERALTEIVRRHEVLRTTFPTENGKAVQRVKAPWTVSLPVTDFSALAEDARGAAVQQWLQDHFARDFDLSVLPLIRFSLLRLAPDEHVLVDVEHHLVHDGWSVNTLLREIVTLYHAFAAGEASPLPDLEVQFGDYAVWQREWLRGDAARAQLDFWRARLAGGTPVLELPGDRPRPPVPSYRGAAPRFHLPPETYKALREASRREGATLFMTMLAAFQALLARWSGQDDLTVGTAVAARRHRQTEPLIGMFVNMVALRTDLGGDPTFRELLHRVRRTTLDAYAHQDVPFEAVVEAVRPERSLSHNPLFQAAFSFHDSARPELALPGAVLEIEPGLGNGSAKFDVNVIVIPHGEQAVGGGAHGRDDITLIWEYAADRFDAPTIERMVGHYRTLLAAAAACPGTRLSDLPLLDERERRQVVQGWNRTRREHAWAGGVPARVEEWARRTPDGLAVSAADGTLTYAQLDERASLLACALRRRGAGPETRVAVCLERGAHAIVAMLAAIKAGAAYLPVDPAYPAERISYMLADGGACTLVTSAALMNRLPERTPCMVLVDCDHTPEHERPFQPAPAHPESAAYVIYTSGSTGTPKGVVVTHGGLMNLAMWHQEAFGVTPAERATQMASAGFDASAWEVWPYLAAGASLHVIPDEARADPAALRDRIVSERITLAFVPTPVAEPLLALEWPRRPALRTLLVGGDRLRVRPSAALPFRVVNNYGPTEATVVATSGSVRIADEGAPSIGGPVANATAYALDPRGRPAPLGVPGELHVGGAGVARGYLGRPALTAERFIPDPFSGTPGARLYRTGDRVRWRADGEIEFLGRTDHQVKIRGVRLEPGEVEAALLAHHAVRAATVTAREDGPGGEARLVAYLAGTAVPDGVLRAHLRAHLPATLVPSAFVWLPRLPLSPNGKVDTRALPAPPAAEAEVAYQAPRTPAEESLARIWAEVLGRERVGVTDDFFALGGHSLQATQIGSRVREAFGTELPIRAVFEAPTVAALAARIADAAAVPTASGRIRPLARRARAAVES